MRVGVEVDKDDAESAHDLLSGKIVQKGPENEQRAPVDRSPSIRCGIQKVIVDLVGVGADDLTTADRAEPDPGERIDCVLDEVDRSVAEERVDPAGVLAASGGVRPEVGVDVLAGGECPR